MIKNTDPERDGIFIRPLDVNPMTDVVFEITGLDELRKKYEQAIQDARTKLDNDPELQGMIQRLARVAQLPEEKVRENVYRAILAPYLGK